MMDDSVVTVHLETATLPREALAITELDGREAISSLFDFRLTVLYRDPLGVDAEQLLAQPATLVWTRGTVEERRLHGMIAEVEDRWDDDSDHAAYRLRFVPRAWRLCLHTTVEVYLDLGIPAIVSRLLGEIGFAAEQDFEFRLRGSYPAKEFLVQYQENHLDFISRLLEHHGISYYFEHRDGRDVMIFADDNSSFSTLAADRAIDYHPRGTKEGVYRLQSCTRAVPRRYVVRDYNYRQPKVYLQGSAEVWGGQGGEVVEYGAHFQTPEQGQALARIRAEELLCRKQRYGGASAEPRLYPGLIFTLRGLPGGDRSLLLSELQHSARQPGFGQGDGTRPVYNNTFTAHSPDVSFRPERRTPRPHIDGVLNGAIEADDDPRYAKVDDEGRYYVKFLFDTAAAGELRASHPIRMAQPHAGNGYGMHFPLRPGTEVLVAFENGDPDRPIIAGTVPNAATPSPVRAENATHNVIRTGGANEIDIDDKEGSERIKMSTPFMATQFQLGAPNAPETGAILATAGASTGVAALGMGFISSSMSKIIEGTQLSSAGDIVSVAKPSSASKKKKLGFGIGAVMLVLGAALGAMKGTMSAISKSKQVDLDKQKGEVNQAEAAMQAAQSDYFAARDTLKASWPQDYGSPPGLAGKSRSEVERLVDEKITAMSPRALRQAIADGGYPDQAAYRQALIGRYLYHGRLQAVDQACKDFESARFTLSKKEAAVLSARQSDKRTEWCDEEKEYANERARNLQDKERFRQEAENAANKKQAALEAALDALMTAQEHLAQAADLKGKVINLRVKDRALYSEKKDLVEVQDKYDETAYEFSEKGGAGQVASVANSALTGAGALVTLVSGAYLLYKKVLKKKEELESEYHWLTGVKTYGLYVKPRLMPTPNDNPLGKPAETFPFWQRKTATKTRRFVPKKLGGSKTVGKHSTGHTLGSVGNLNMYGDEKVFVRGETVFIYGCEKLGDGTLLPKKGKVTVMAEDETTILAKNRAELKGVKQTLLSGEEIDLESEKGMKLASKEDAITAKAKRAVSLMSTDDRLEVKAKQTVSLSSADADITAAAPKGGISGSAKTVELKGDDSVTIKQGNLQILLKNEKLTIIGSKDMKISTAGKLTLEGGAGVQIDGNTNVKINAAQVELG